MLVETLSQDAAKLKYGGNSFMNQEALEINPIADEEPWYGVPAPRGMMVLYHYFNKVTKDYIIVVNRSALLYEGKMTYRHGKLPFDVCQHYPDSACIYGISIPRKVRVPRAYKVNIMQSIMDGSRLNSGKIILANNTGENQD